MKKFLLIACAIATATFAFAIPTQKKAEKVNQVTPNFHFVNRTDVSPVITEGLVANKVANLVSDTTWGAYYVANVPEWHTGAPSNGLGYVSEAQIIVPYTDFVVFASAYKPNTSWYVNDTEVAKDTSLYWLKETTFDTYPLPTIKTDKFTQGDSIEVVFNDFQFGKLFTSYYAQYGFENYLNVGPDYASMTQCAMFTEQVLDSRGNETYGSDWTFVGAGELGTYSYGSKLLNPYKADGSYFDTIISNISNMGTLYVDYISLGVYTAGSSILGVGDSIKLDIVPVKDNKIHFGEILYSASATLEDFTSEGWYGILNFYFKEIDQWGGVQEIPAIIDGNFAVVITGFNSGSADLGFICDYYTPFDGQTYFCYDNKITPLWNSPGNLLMTFYGLNPVATNMPDTISTDLINANTVTVNVENNVWDEEWDWSDLPDWLDLEIVGKYDTTTSEGKEYVEYLYNADIKAHFAEIAPDDSREAEVTLDLMGKEYKVVFRQVGKAVGLNNVKAINDNKTYNIFGVEVNKDYKGVVIKNGTKLLQ